MCKRKSWLDLFIIHRTKVKTASEGRTLSALNWNQLSITFRYKYRTSFLYKIIYYSKPLPILRCDNIRFLIWIWSILLHSKITDTPAIQFAANIELRDFQEIKNIERCKYAGSYNSHNAAQRQLFCSALPLPQTLTPFTLHTPSVIF